MILDLLQKRTSVRHFQDRPIPEPVIQALLEAGRLSPSGGNEQPWRFLAITDPDLIQRIADLAYGQTWIARAKLLMVLCTVLVPDHRGGRDIQAERFPELREEILDLDPTLYGRLNLEEHQTKIPGTHMVLVGLEYGLGSTWISRFPVRELAKLLDLPDWIPSELIAFGYPARPGSPTPKKDLSEIAFRM